MLVIDPVAFALGPFQIHWYGIIMGTAAMLGLYLAVREGKRQGIDTDKLLDMMIWVLPSAIIGARLYYVLFEWEYYATHPEEIIAVWKGGLAIHGGLIAAFLVGYLFIRKHKLSFLQLADIVAPSILLAQAIGRWGNFINQEAHGGPVSVTFLQSLQLPNWIIEQMTIGGVTYHPTFLYESLWNLVGFGVLLFLRYVVVPKRGEILFGYMIWYSLGRFFIEGLRTDSLAFNGPDWLASLLQFLWAPMGVVFQAGELTGGNIRIAQLISMLSVVIAIGIVIWRRVKKSEVNTSKQAKTQTVSTEVKTNN
ncbi:prolipoprotein diacylglyceryl transferase [Shimazuella kribbensis]|uniref:prolipoprotein diacylglyceryl transferase n=1 Tax=Shimazuella kribbensis TaxID=139808 RepID=UPI00041582A8|nr:prolipoprotein diacylglyceryl transferase [Shimazuella kribbensis]